MEVLKKSQSNLVVRVTEVKNLCPQRQEHCEQTEMAPNGYLEIWMDMKSWSLVLSRNLS